MQYFADIVKEKNVLFITTKNIDYIRNTQELRILRENASNIEIIASTKKNYFLRIFHVWSQITKKKIKSADVIFVGFEPQFVIPFLGNRFKNKPIVIDFFISVYDTMICDRQKFKDGGIIAKFAHWMDVKTIKTANHVITDTKAHAEYFEEEFDGDSSKFEVVYLEADKKIYYPRKQSKSETLKDRFVVLYFGSILPLQGVDVVLDAIRELKDCRKVYFDVIGPIPEKYQKPIQDNVRYTEWLPQEKLAERIANADLCLAGHFSGTINKAWRTIPGKAYIYEMMGKSMILGDSTANHELFREDEKHHFVEMGNKTSLSKAILEKMNI